MTPPTSPATGTRSGRSCAWPSNPAGHRDQHLEGQTLEPWLPVLRDYKDLGGEIITVGSDAHAPEPLGKGLREAYAMMADCGFRYVAVYHQRKPEMIRLK